MSPIPLDRIGAEALADLLHPLLLQADRLFVANIVKGFGDLVLLLPPSMFPGVSMVYGMSVVRADVTDPMIGLRP